MIRYLAPSLYDVEVRVAALLLVAGCGFTGLAGGGGGDASPAGRSFVKKISIHPTQAGADVTGFPMLFAEAADGDLVGRAVADLSFADDSGVLPVEIERFEPATGAIAAWVRVPVLHDAVATPLLLRVGVPAMPAVESVWDDDFAGVYHFADGAGTASVDSTPRHHDGVRVGMPAIVAGVAGDGLTFTNAGDYVSLGSQISLAGRFTISLWTTAASDTPQKYGRLVSRCDVVPSRNGITLEQNMPVGFAYATRTAPAGASVFASDATPLSTSAVTFLSVTYDGAVLMLLENGRASSMADVHTLGDPVSTLTIGEEVYPPSTASDGYQGTIDEVRFSTTARSLAWQNAELKNTRSPESFYDVLGKSTVNVDP